MILVFLSSRFFSLFIFTTQHSSLLSSPLPLSLLGSRFVLVLCLSRSSYVFSSLVLFTPASRRPARPPRAAWAAATPAAGRWAWVPPPLPLLQPRTRAAARPRTHSPPLRSRTWRPGSGPPGRPGPNEKKMERWVEKEERTQRDAPLSLSLPVHSPYTCTRAGQTAQTFLE